MATSFQVVIDCADPDALARFWAEALHYVMQSPPPGFDTWEDFLRANNVPESEWNSRSAVVDPDGVGPRVFFQRVPESKVAKNRLHLDLHVGGGPGTDLAERHTRVDAEVERLTGLHASRVEAFEEMGEYWVTMRDPEGNEFDVQ